MLQEVEKLLDYEHKVKAELFKVRAALQKIQDNCRHEYFGSVCQQCGRNKNDEKT